MRQVWLAVLCLVAGWLPAQDQPLQYSTRLRTVEPGGKCHVWFPQNVAGPSGRGYIPKLPVGWTYAYPGTYGRGWSEWHRGWAWEIQVARDAQPGAYALDFMDQGQPVPGLTPIVVTVCAPAPKRRLKRLMSATTADLQFYLDQGYDLELGPFEFVITTPLQVPDGARICSTGAARLVRTADRHPENHPHHEMFIPEGRFTLERVILTHDGTMPAEPLYLHKWPRDTSPTCPNVTVTQCVIERGYLGKATESNMAVERCRFAGGGTGITPLNGRYDYCEFTGTSPDQSHRFLCWGANGLLLTNNRFAGTSRGFVFQTGDVVGAALLDNYCTGIRGGSGNANECLLFEAGTGSPIACDDAHGCRNNLVVDLWINDCAGPGVSLYGSGMHDNQFWGVDAHTDNSSLYVIAIGDGQITRNQFHNWQCTGGVVFHGDVGQVTFGNMQLLESQQRRGNQGPFAPVIRHFNEHYPFDLDEEARQTGVFTLSGVGLLMPNRTYVPIDELTGKK